MSKTKYKYFLKITNPDLTTAYDFQWKKSGLVKCPDWNAKPICGQGLHGFWSDKIEMHALTYDMYDAMFLMIKAPEKLCVNLNGKWKFPYCHVLKVSKDPFDILIELRKTCPTWNKRVILTTTHECAINYCGQASAYLLSYDNSTFTHIKKGCVIKYNDQKEIVVNGNDYPLAKTSLIYNKTYYINLAYNTYGFLNTLDIKSLG